SVTSHSLDPADLGIPRGTAEGLRGRDAAFNADVVRRVVAGEQGQVRDAVVLNAGAALAIHAAEEGSLEERVAAGMVRAKESIDSGQAKAVLEKWVEVSSQV
ncbi:MAG TPA: anthranilate phosphoribosyltransferase, partial [Nocardioidaceae bacterium]